MCTWWNAVTTVLVIVSPADTIKLLCGCASRSLSPVSSRKLCNCVIMQASVLEPTISYYSGTHCPISMSTGVSTARVHGRHYGHTCSRAVLVTSVSFTAREHGCSVHATRDPCMGENTDSVYRAFF